LLAPLTPQQLAAFLKQTSERELEAIEHDWGWWGRPNQQAPKGDWRTWLLLAGRGFGKTRSGAECIRDQVIHHRRRRIALVAPTAADARDVMVEGESGLLGIGPPQQRPRYEPTKRRLTWPNGANGHAGQSRSIASTKPIELWPRSTTAGIWLRAQSG
jgi:phage terminase large subunit-like protein